MKGFGYTLFMLFLLYFFAAGKLLGQSIIKGPYMQIGTANSMIIRWETDSLTNSKVCYGTGIFNLNIFKTDLTITKTHSIQLNALSPSTKYYYSIGTTTSVLQGDTNNYFITSPTPGTRGKYRFWITGDCGIPSANQVNSKNQYLLYNGSGITNGWLLLGDNAYYSGFDTEYNTGFFATYQTDILKKTVLWPAPGNHDYNNGSSPTPTVPYFDIFSTPANAEAGGVPSGSPAYYSFDYGNIHFLSLDSYGIDTANKKMYDTTSAQALWVKQDLAANNKEWTIVYFHHPPFSMGSHNSDTELDLVQIRTDFVKLLETRKVDIVLSGHSHDYERSKLMKGHYGPEATFSPTIHLLDSSNALYDGSTNSCAYLKDTVNNKFGTVYIVAGSAGQLGGTQSSFPHDAMFYSNASIGGSLLLDVNANRLDLKWLCSDGVIRDKFTMFKNVNSVKTLTVYPNQNFTLNAGWQGSYLWSTSATTQTLQLNVSSNSSYWVKDTNNCFTDTFNLKVVPDANFYYLPSFCQNAPVTFSDVSTNSPVAWSWSVNPPVGVSINSPTAPNPTFLFSNAGAYSVSLVASNVYGQSAIKTKLVIVNICQGINEGVKASKNFHIFPNPNNGVFNVEIKDERDYEISVYNSLGIEVLKQKMEHGNNLMIINESPGIYCYRIKEKNGSVNTGKLIMSEK